ncbi:MAG: ABC transporter permease, partial [Sphingomonadaceae bacterium]|nr:ABC transporter permease [Sphingomonadaceae bacterium]
FAAILPISSPLTMVARAAQEPALWPHAAALAWQALWVALIVRFAARRFRIGVLKSGTPIRGRSRWRKAGEVAADAAQALRP